MKVKKILAVPVLVVLMATVLFGCSPTLEKKAEEYLVKYDDTFTYVDKKENNGSNTYYFSSQKFPGETVSVHYEAAFESLGREPFSDNYASLMLREDGLKKGREIIDKAFPGADYEICQSRGEYSNYFDKDSDFALFYAAQGAHYGVVMYKNVTEEELKADSEKLKEALMGEKDAVQMATAQAGVRVLYYPEDAAKTGVSSYEDFDKLTDYSAVLRVNFSKVKEECTVEEMELK